MVSVVIYSASGPMMCAAGVKSSEKGVWQRSRRSGPV